jgi:hypothetical protein
MTSPPDIQASLPNDLPQGHIMSETSKTAETAKRATEQTARFGQTATDAAGKATKDGINETNRAAQNGANNGQEAGQHAMQTATDAAHAAAEVASRVADISLGRGHRLVTSAAHAMDVYRDASERSVERAQALFSSYVTFGRGLHDMRHVWLEIVDHTLENATHKPQGLLRCKNMVELAEVQRDLYLGAVNHALESTSRLMEIAGRTVQDAVRPLQQNRH